MTITLQHCAEEMAHTLGKREGGHDPASVKRLANRAGEWLYSTHAWKFREERVAHLNLRASFSVTGATYTESTKNLASTGDFASYTFVSGDEIEVTAGTGATLGFYHVASRTDDDNIVLEESIGSAADGQSDIAFSFTAETVALPSDFAEAVHIEARDSVTEFFKWVSHQELQEMRNSEPSAGSLGYYGAIVYHTKASGGETVPVLEVWPEPSAASTAALKLMYRSSWAELDDDNTVVALPSWMETVYIETLRAFARGYYEEDVAPLATQLEVIERSSFMLAAKRRDGSIQPRYGFLRGGAAESAPSNAGHFWGNFVQAPS